MICLPPEVMENDREYEFPKYFEDLRFAADADLKKRRSN